MTIKTNNFLPDIFKTPANKKFLNATLDQLVTEPNLRKINGYVGRKFAPTFKKSDNYLIEDSADRQNYQLEPCVVTTNSLGDIQFLSSYHDLIQKIQYYGGVTSNHSRMFSNEAYSFDGQVDFDKLVNFSQYYWIPNGPDPVDVYAGGVDLSQEYVVTRDTIQSSYSVSGFGRVQNPDIILARGGRYTFTVNQTGDQFWIQTTPGISGTVLNKANISSREVYGVEDNGASNGTVVFNVPLSDEQDYFASMPSTTVDFATTLRFVDVQHKLVQNLTNGIDGITSEFHGKYVVFINNDVSDTAWENKGVYALHRYDEDKNVTDNKDEDPFDNGPYIPVNRRAGIWQIQITVIDGTELIELVWIKDIPQNNKVIVLSGTTFANVEFYKTNVGTIARCPIITAPLTQLYYNDGKDQRFYGRILIVNPNDSTINIDDSIIGKKNYTSPNGVVFTNGLKVRFNSNALPAIYADRLCYVEGVGTSISLTPVDTLVTPEIEDASSIPFDVYGFSDEFFDESLNGPLTPEYITINRSSMDVNIWSRSNRWFHNDVINVTAKYNNTVPLFDQLSRATRPIIEFNANLQLFNHGKIGQHVDVLDFTITDAFNEVELINSNFFTTSKFKDGMTIIFANDNDPIVRNQIYTVNVLKIQGTSKIHLTEVTGGKIIHDDSIIPLSGCTVSMDDFDLTSPLALNPIARKMSQNNGIRVLPLNGVLTPTTGLLLGYSFWFNGTSWIKSQQKVGVNSAPLFDIFNSDGISFSDSMYANSTFAGNSIFSYKKGTGTNDSVLGFPISHRNFNNVGDIEFENTFDINTFNETVDKKIISHRINTGTLFKNISRDESVAVNVWTTLDEKTKQYQILSNTCDGSTSYFEIDILPDDQQVAPNIKVFVNNSQIASSSFSIVDVGARKAVLVTSTLAIGDKVDILIYSSSVSKFGYYEIPYNLDFNPLNENFTSLTLGQFRNHLSLMSNNNGSVVGLVPGASNIRDLNVKSCGGSILQHSSPTVYSSLFLIDKDVNFIDSVSYAQHEYQKFKTRFLESATLAVNAEIIDPPAAVDFILHHLNEVKNSTSPWYYSDMVPYDQNNTEISYTVLNTELREYEIDTIFDDTVLGSKAMLVYRNGKQLLKGIDYIFNQTRPSIIFSNMLDYDDLIQIRVYHNTDGCYIPETPTKLGLYPKFTPEIYADTTYQNPVSMIRGHDGSLTPKFNDLRDELLLELEKRIYNNIKTTYDHSNFDINSVIPGRFRDTGYSRNEFNQIVSRCFLNWVSSTRIDYATNEWFNGNNPWTWNYHRFNDVGGEALPGFWRGIYKYFYDTDAPHERPWEALGFSEMPLWWVDTYGPAPYTGGNLVLWNDLETGTIRYGHRAGVDLRYARPGLSKVIPVTDSGELKSPNEVVTSMSSSSESSGSFSIGDQAPIESAWRNSSAYPFAVQQALSLMTPAVYFSQLATIHNYSKNDAINQFVQVSTRQRITPSDFIINGGIARNAGYLNWIVDYITSYGSDPASKINSHLSTLGTRLGYKAAGFTDKTYLRVLAEQSSPGSTNDSIIIPDENYKIHLHKSAPIDRLVYSAVIIEKTVAGFSISGYNSENPIFTIIPSDANSNQRIIKVGESTGVVYKNYQPVKITIPYGYEFRNKQQVVDFLVSYERYLKSQGFVFEEFNQTLGEMMNWELAAKEFLTWTEQGWAPGNIIVVSPVANSITVNYAGAVADHVSNTPLGSKVLDVGFNTISPNMFNITREGEIFNLLTESEVTVGLLDLNLVQYEHVLVFDNTTLFNDIIYKPSLGNRQYRLKLIGNKTSAWDGQLSAPGFVFNNAKIDAWQPSKDYKKGELVTFKNAIYTALQFTVATDTFIYSQWQQIDKSTLKSGLLPNFAYNAKKFENMYDIDNQILDQNINAFSNGLLGYRERGFMSELGVNPTSQAKFYQGYIRDKGTRDAITSLATATFNNLTGNIKFNEEWAFRVGEYGAIESNQFVEVQLSDDKYSYDPVAISFLSPGEISDIGVVGEYKTTLYKKPITYTPNIFATRNDDSIYENDIKTAGYVNVNDVDATIFDINDYASSNSLVPELRSGFKIWVAKDVNQEWNVYRVDETSIIVSEISYALDSLAYFSMPQPHKLEVDDMFVVRNFSKDADGFYKVIRLEDINTVVATVTSSFETVLLETPTLGGNGTMFKLQSVRYDSLPDITSYSPINGWKTTDNVWIDNADGKWEVFNKTLPWTFNNILPGDKLAASSTYGHRLALSRDGGIVVATAPGLSSNSVRMLVREASDEFVESYGIIIPESSSTVGSSLSLSPSNIAVSSTTPTGIQNSVLIYSLDGAKVIKLVEPATSPPILDSDPIVITLDEISDDVITATELGLPLTISGSTIGVEDGQIASVVFNGRTYTGTVTGGLFKVKVPVADLALLTDRTTYIATASVSNLAGNIATPDTETVHTDTSDYQEIVDNGAITIRDASLTSTGYGYESKPNVVVINQQVRSSDGTSTYLDTGSGLELEITGYTIDGTTSGVKGVTLLDAGSGYTTDDTIVVTVSGAHGIGTVATADTTVDAGSVGPVTSISLTSPGEGYTTQPSVIITGDGTGATAEVTGTIIPEVRSPISAVTLTSPGSGYTAKPIATVVGDGTGATVEVIGNDIPEERSSVTRVTLIHPGAGYTEAPAVTLTGGDGSGAIVDPVGLTSGGSIDTATLLNPGSGFKTKPTVVVTGAAVRPARLEVTGTQTSSDIYTITGLNVIDAGLGYKSPPSVTIQSDDIQSETKTISNTTTGVGGSHGAIGVISALNATPSAWHKHITITIPLNDPNLFSFKNLFLCVDNGGGSPLVATSLDGRTWVSRSIYDSTTRNVPLLLGNIVTVGDKAYALSKQAPTSYNSTPISDFSILLTSTTDAVVWNSENTNIIPIKSAQQSDGATFNNSSTTLAHNGTMFACIQPYKETPTSAVRHVMLTSIDGIVWRNTGDVNGADIATNGNTFVVYNKGVDAASTYNDIKFWTSTNASNWVEHQINLGVIPAGTTFRLESVKVLNNKYFAFINQTTISSTSGQISTYSSAYTYFLYESPDCQTWVQHILGTGNDNTTTNYGVTPSVETRTFSGTVFSGMTWNGTVYVLLSSGYSGSSDGKSMAVSDPANQRINTSTDLTTWLSGHVDNTSSWTTIASNGIKMCVLGRNTGSSTTSPGSITSYSVDNMREVTTTTTSTVTTAGTTSYTPMVLPAPGTSTTMLIGHTYVIGNALTDIRVSGGEDTWPHLKDYNVITSTGEVVGIVRCWSCNAKNVTVTSGGSGMIDGSYNYSNKYFAGVITISGGAVTSISITTGGSGYSGNQVSDINTIMLQTIANCNGTGAVVAPKFTVNAFGKLGINGYAYVTGYNGYTHSVMYKGFATTPTLSVAGSTVVITPIMSNILATNTNYGTRFTPDWSATDFTRAYMNDPTSVGAKAIVTAATTSEVVTPTTSKTIIKPLGVAKTTKTTTTRDITFTRNSNVYLNPVFSAIAAATVTPSSYSLTGLKITNPGSGYRVAPVVTIVGGTTPATAIVEVNYKSAYFKVDGITLTNPGSNYLATPTVTITPSNGIGSGATATATVISTPFAYTITGITLLTSGSGYSSNPIVTIPGGTATATAKVKLPITITGITVTDPGAGFTDVPTVTISPSTASPTTPATATALVDVVRPFVMTGVDVVSPGEGYLALPLLQIVPTDGLGAGATIDLDFTTSKFAENVTLSNDGQWMFISSPAAGVVNCYKKDTATNKFEMYQRISGLPNVDFGERVVINDDSKMLIIGAKSSIVDNVVAAGTVHVYFYQSGEFTHIQKIAAPTLMTSSKFGSSLALRKNGAELLVGAPNINEPAYKHGIVYRFLANVDRTYSLVQEIRKPFLQFDERFGVEIAADDNVDYILISSQGATDINVATYDNNEMTLDGATTSIIDSVRNAGAVYVFDLLSDSVTEKYCFNQQLSLATVAQGDDFGRSIAVRKGIAMVGSPLSDYNMVDAGKILRFDNLTNSLGWSGIRHYKPTVDLDNVTRMYLYDRKSQTILTNLDYIDPAKGKILGVADQDISYRTTFDPAIYNVGTNTSVNIDSGFYWASERVGKVWWNLSDICYIDYEQDSITYRNKHWAQEFPGSKIEVLEWVESNVIPSAYSVDGEAKYADNSAYVMHNIVDPFTGIIQTKYYFWVKNKTIVPTIAGRRVSVASIADIIANPDKQGIPYAAILQNNSISLINAASYISADDTILHIDYSLLNDTNIIHNEYELVSEGSDSATLPTKIVNKLVDSLSGSDKFGNLVPDYSLNASERYGTSIRPRQTMIVNRLTAVKNLCQFVNNVFKTVPVVEEFDITDLYTADPAPIAGSVIKNPVTGVETLQWNIEVETLEERSYYDQDLLNVGENVLVRNDSNFNNQWTIYKIKEKTTSGVVFSLVKSQSYYTPDYWEKVDWFDSSYDPTIKPTYTVPTFKDIGRLTVKNGNTIHVTNNGDGRFSVYKVTSTLSLILVGVQYGTIQLKDSLWAHNTNSIGFGNDNFDTVKFDLNPDVELRIILNTIQNKIFKNTLDGQFNKLFFMLLNYIMSEQRMVDWAFKTSFVSIIHNLRKLDQFPNYIKDNQSYYEDYINEVKPYRTKIREYIINYEGQDDANIYLTDFDLPSYFDTDLNSWRSPSGEHARDDVLLSTEAKYEPWQYNHGNVIRSIQVTNAGYGYTPTPRVTVLIDGDITRPDTTADLIAVVDFYTGSILKIIINNPGVVHYSTPTIRIEGDGVDKNGVQTCVLYPIMNNHNVRTFDTALKFDRITYTSAIKPWVAAQPNAVPPIPGKQYYTNRLADIVIYMNKSYKCKVDFESGTVFNTINWILLSDKDLADLALMGYPPAVLYMPSTMYYGDKKADIVSYHNRAYKCKADFVSLSYFHPDYWSLVDDADLENAADRAMALYAPTVGMPPKDLARLYAGIEYPGNKVDGSKFVGDLEQDTNIQSFFKDLELGTRPEDINIVGGAFVDTYNSHAPEEFLPGLIFDTLDIKVFTVDPDDATNAPIGYRISKTMARECVTAFDGTSTSFDNATQSTIFDFNLEAWEFRRISAAHTTTLAMPLKIFDTAIYVVDASVLPEPKPHLNRPGVIYINGEKITYYTVDEETNALGQIRRGVWGTGAPLTHPAGTLVVDAGLDQQIPSNTSAGNSSGRVATMHWLRPGTVTPVFGDGLRPSDTPQAMFIKAQPSYLPSLPGEIIGWVDPELSVTTFDQSGNPILDSSGHPVLDSLGNPTYAAPVHPFDIEPFDSKTVE